MTKRISIHFLAFDGCPNAAPALAQLKTLLTQLGRAQFELNRIDTGAQDCDKGLASWPSPTILVDGGEIDGTQPANDMSCRVLDDGYWGRLRGHLDEKLKVV